VWQRTQALGIRIYQSCVPNHDAKRSSTCSRSGRSTRHDDAQFDATLHRFDERVAGTGAAIGACRSGGPNTGGCARHGGAAATRRIHGGGFAVRPPSGIARARGLVAGEKAKGRIVVLDEYWARRNTRRQAFCNSAHRHAARFKQKAGGASDNTRSACTARFPAECTATHGNHGDLLRTMNQRLSLAPLRQMPEE